MAPFPVFTTTKTVRKKGAHVDIKINWTPKHLSDSAETLNSNNDTWTPHPIVAEDVTM